VRILALIDECGASGALPSVDAKSWTARLDPLDAVGAHGEFFRGIAEATHPAFNGRKDAWDLAPNDAAYPAYAIAANPTARSAAGRRDGSPVERLGWLANLHYWTILVLLDGYFRAPNNMVLTLARGQMLGPLRALGHALPTLGGGAPFDQAPIDLAAGREPTASLAAAKDLLHEAAAVAASLGDRLPDDYKPQSITEALSLIDRATTQMARQRAAAASRG